MARSSSLAVSFIIGAVFFKAEYTTKELVAVASVTVGILVTLNAEAEAKRKVTELDCTGEK